MTEDTARRGALAAGPPGDTGPSPGDPATPPEHSLGFLLPRVAHSLDRAFEEMLAAYDIRGSHLGVLSTLRAYGPLAQQRIAAYLGLERQTLVNVADDLERRGLVERHPHPRDRRLQVLRLTAAGRAFHDRVDAAAEAHQHRVYGALSEVEQETLGRILRKLAPSGHFEALFTTPRRDDEKE